jgi:hypothetical protein
LNKKYSKKPKNPKEIFEIISKEYSDDFPFDLIALFLKFNPEFQFTKHIESIAKKQEWKPLLNEKLVQLKEYEIYRLIEEHFKESNLKESLLVFLDNDQEDIQVLSSLDACKEMDLKDASIFLLKKSLEMRIPVMSVISYTVNESIRSKCFITYLYTSMDVQMKEIEGILDNDSNGAFLLNQLIIKYCQMKKTSILLQSFEIFDPKNPFIFLIEFFDCFYTLEFDETEEKLKSFLQLQLREDVKNASESLIFEFGANLDNYYERTKYLEILNKFQMLSTLFTVIHSLI